MTSPPLVFNPAITSLSLTRLLHLTPWWYVKGLGTTSTSEVEKRSNSKCFLRHTQDKPVQLKKGKDEYMKSFWRVFFYSTSTFILHSQSFSILHFITCEESSEGRNQDLTQDHFPLVTPLFQQQEKNATQKPQSSWLQH